MGTDREARALGAGDILEVEGNKYTLRPIVVKQLCDLEREALEYYKRQYLKTYFDNLDFIEPESKRNELMEKKLEEAAQWDVSSLPQKEVFDASRIPVNDKVKEWVKKTFDITPSDDIIYSAALSLALDTEKIKPAELQEMTGIAPRKGLVRYDQWWVTASTEGMTRFVYASLRNEQDNKLTYKDICEWPYLKLAEASRIVEKITVAQMGNG